MLRFNRKRMGKIMADKGEGQTYLAQKLGVSRQLIWQYLHTPGKNMGLRCISRIADGLGVSAIDLISHRKRDWRKRKNGK